MDRYGPQYEARVRAIRDRLAARGLEDAELDRLMDGTYTTADVGKVADRLDSLARKLPEPGVK